jgi:hypothetical protein
MEFDHFGLSVKVLITKRVLARYDSTGPLYTLSLAASSTPTHVFSCMPWPGCCCFLHFLTLLSRLPRPQRPLQAVEQLIYHLSSR